MRLHRLEAVTAVAAAAVVIGCRLSRRLRGAATGGPDERRLSLLESLPGSPCDLMFLGDSLSYEGEWCALFPDLQVRNFGIPGETSNDVLRRIAQVQKMRPTTVILTIGSNDLSRGVPLETTIGNIGRIVDYLEADGAEVVLVGIPPRSCGFVDRVRDLNRHLARLASIRGRPFVDLYDTMADARGNLRGDLTNDGVHLLGPAYLLWRDALASLVPSLPATIPDGP